MYSLKFGGTSMGSGSSIRNVADILIAFPDKQKSVVVSAMSGTTDMLIEAGERAKLGDIDQVKDLLEVIQKNHISAMKDLVKKPDIQEFSRGFISNQVHKMSEFLEAITVIREISPRSHDEIIALGEKLSAHLLTVHLRDRGVDTEFVSLENIVPDAYSYVDRNFFEEIKTLIYDRISPLIHRGAIPVITGFFGKIPGGIIGAVGRGYSDFTASLVGNACEAQEIQIWTDVDGVLSADPRIVNDPIALDKLSFEEASELANFGAKVIHPQTIWPAVKRNIPVRIKNTLNPQAEGTLVTEEGFHSSSPFKSVTAKKGITVITLHSFEQSGYGFMEKVFSVFSSYECSIDIISTSEASVSIGVSVDEKKVHALVKNLEVFSRVGVEYKNAILAVIGCEMKNNKGIAGRIFSAIGEKGINIKMISQGATELNISMIIKEEDVFLSIEAVHQTFFSASKSNK